MTPLPAPQALDAYFLDARSKLLDLAAIFDRIDRGLEAESVTSDARYEKLKRALTILQRNDDGRAEKVQQLFSLDYDPKWRRPAPR